MHALRPYAQGKWFCFRRRTGLGGPARLLRVLKQRLHVAGARLSSRLSIAAGGTVTVNVASPPAQATGQNREPFSHGKLPSQLNHETER